MFKIPVAYDFTLVKYEEKLKLYFSVEPCTLISDAQASEMKQTQRST